MIERIVSRLDKVCQVENPTLKWLFSFCLIFTVGFLSMVLVCSPLVLLGASWAQVLGGAIGCGIGTGLINATIITLFC